MNNHKLLGVCSWLSNKFDLDVGGIRILFIASTILAFGSPVLVYLLLYLVKPKKY